MKTSRLLTTNARTFTVKDQVIFQGWITVHSVPLRKCTPEGHLKPDWE